MSKQGSVDKHPNALCMHTTSTAAQVKPRRSAASLIYSFISCLLFFFNDRELCWKCQLPTFLIAKEPKTCPAYGSAELQSLSHQPRQQHPDLKLKKRNRPQSQTNKPPPSQNQTITRGSSTLSDWHIPRAQWNLESPDLGNHKASTTTAGPWHICHSTPEPILNIANIS